MTEYKETSAADREQIRRAARSVFHVTPDDTVLTLMSAQVDDKIDAKIKTAISSVKLWAFGGVAANLLPFIFLAYEFGQFSETVNRSLEVVERQQTTLEQRGAWMGETDRRIGALEQWAEPQGFVPPRQGHLPD